MQDCVVEGVRQMFGGPIFRVERNITIGQSPKILGNFSKMCIKINKTLKNYRENLRKNSNFSEMLLIFGQAIIF